MNGKYKSRKFIVMLVVFATSTGLLIGGFIDAGVWQWAAGGSAVGYLGAQGITDALGALKS